MKSTLLSLPFLILFFTSYSQKVTYKNLIRTQWVSLDTDSYVITTYKFIDSTTMMDSSWTPSYHPVEKRIRKYSLDTANNTTILTILKDVGKNTIENWSYCITIKDEDTLILQAYSIPSIYANREMIFRKINDKYWK